MTEIGKLTITVKEAAQMYGMCENTFRKLVHRPDFPKVVAGRRIIIVKNLLIEFMERLAKE